MQPDEIFPNVFDFSQWRMITSKNSQIEDRPFSVVRNCLLMFGIHANRSTVTVSLEVKKEKHQYPIIQFWKSLFISWGMKICD